MYLRIFVYVVTQFSTGLARYRSHDGSEIEMLSRALLKTLEE
jgi:hypothetical protein